MRINRIFISAISLVALVALAGMASAYTVTVDKIQRNGNYIGTPVLMASDTQRYGYSYDFYPDGTYTLLGTAANNDNTSVVLSVSLSDAQQSTDSKTILVPAAGTDPGKVAFTLTTKTPWSFQYGSGQDMHTILDVLNKYDVVDAGNSTPHTVDQGPMSDAVAIFSNGKLTYKGMPAYSIGLARP